MPSRIRDRLKRPRRVRPRRPQAPAPLPDPTAVENYLQGELAHLADLIRPVPNSRPIRRRHRPDSH